MRWADIESVAGKSSDGLGERVGDETATLANKELSMESPHWLGGEIPFPCNDTTYAHVIPLCLS